MSSRFRGFSAAALVLALTAAVPAVRAADVDPAVTRINDFDAALIDAMKQGAALGAKGRARKLAPTIDQTFDIPAMIRFAVGPPWTNMSDADHAALIASFKRFMAASYAHNFDSYNGERFDVDPKVDVRGLDKLVQSHLTPAQGDPVSIVYRMRASGGSWKVIDVFYQGAISQLTTRRSDFAATVASGGATALAAHIDAQTDKLLQ
jgi:phospholipid transport system substrate-binding protein